MPREALSVPKDLISHGLNGFNGLNPLNPFNPWLIRIENQSQARLVACMLNLQRQGISGT